MFFDANMPLSYWVDALYIVVYIINKFLSSTLIMETLFCKLFGMNFDYRGIRSFGWKR